MKKRIISMLLSVLMVMSLFSGMTVSASAATTAYGANVVEYTMAQGDYVLRICQRLGLNYYTCKDAIMALNNINDGQWSKLAVGRTLYLPASDSDAQVIATNARGGAAVTNTATTGIATTGTAATGVASTTAQTSTVSTYASANQNRSGDVLAFYLVPYTMSWGETVSGVCNSLGVNFSIFSSFIANVNGISNWKNVRAGDTLIIPTPVAPAVGTTCYGVMAHTLVSNDTAYSIATSHGLNYYASERLLKALNMKDDLSALKAGNIFCYPVAMSVSVAGTGNPGTTATTTTTSTTTNGNGTTTTTTTTTATLYKLTSSMSSSDGRLLFYVNNAPVTAAPAGATVTVVSETASGKAIDSLTVKHANGQADIRLTGDTFIMPGCDVRVDAAIKSGHDIKISANYSGKAAASVNGVSVLSAVKGAAVVIRSTDPNYEIQSIDAYYSKQVSLDNKTKLAVSASNAFLMPDGDAYVTVTLKPVSTYAFYLNEPTPALGSFYLQVNGSAVTRAAKGTQVTVVTKSLDGYEPIGLVVTNRTTGTPVNVFSNTFTMPGSDVDVQVTFGAKGNNIIILPANGGVVTSNPVDEANTGATVTLTATPEPGYGATPTYDIVRNSDGLKVTMTGANTFIMPKGGVTITPTFRGGAHTITSRFFVSGNAVGGNYQNVSFTTTITRNNQAFKGEFLWDGNTSNDTVSARRQLKNNVFFGDYIDLRYDCGDNIAFVRYDITGTGADPEGVEVANNQANLHGYFQVPNDDITITAYFEQGKVAIGQFALIRGDGDVSYIVNGKSAAACMPGETVSLMPRASHGYRWAGNGTNFADKIIVTRKDNGAIVSLTPFSYTDSTGAVAWGYDFTMPAEGVYIQVAFDPLPFTLTMRCVDETMSPINEAFLSGSGLWQIAINGVVGAADNNPGGMTQIDVEYGDAVIVGMTESGISKYDMVGFRIDGREYIADVKNYFYNFSMVDERAKDLEIVAILRPKVPYNVALYALGATYDATKGNVEFLLLDRNPLNPAQESTTKYGNVGAGHYSTVDAMMNNIDPSSYEKAAIPGDYVAIVVDTPNPMYSVTARDITIVEVNGDSNRVVPAEVTGWTIGGVARNFFVFQMPNSPVNIYVNFAGVSYSLRVRVTDTAGNPVTSGYVQVYTGDVYRDVAADTTFDNVGYNTQVQIGRTALAQAQNMKIAAVEVVTTDPNSTVSYHDNSLNGEGIWFMMPADNVEVRIQVEKGTNNQAAILVDQVYNGTLAFYADPACTIPVTSFNIGDVVYIVDQPFAGYANLGDGELKVYNNGMINTVNRDDGTGLWKFTVQPGQTIFGAVFQPSAVALTVSVVPNTMSVFINGNVFKDGDTFFANVGDYLEFASAEPGFALTGATDYVVPNVASATLSFDLAPTGSKITVKSATAGVNPIITAEDGSAPGTPLNINNVPTGQDVLITASDSGKYIVKRVVVTAAADGTFLAEGTLGIANFTMPAGGAVVTVEYEVRTVDVKFVVPTGYKILVSFNGGTANEIDDTITGAITLKVDDRITYLAKNNAFVITNVSDGSATNFLGGYQVPNVAGPITLTFTCN